MMTVSAFKWVPPFAQGLVRDLRVRWALEEAGLPYEVKLIGPEDQRSAAYLTEQPFGQVPVLHDGDLSLFESGSIVLYIAEKSEALLPDDEAGRARARTWLFAALNSLEIYVGELATIDLFCPNEAWAKERRPAVEDMVNKRLADLDRALGDRDYFDDRFTVGDLIMTTVLRGLRHTTLVADYPRLAAFQARCEARPAFRRALEAQLSTFAKHAPPPAALSRWGRYAIAARYRMAVIASAHARSFALARRLLRRARHRLGDGLLGRRRSSRGRGRWRGLGRDGRQRRRGRRERAVRERCSCGAGEGLRAAVIAPIDRR